MSDGCIIKRPGEKSCRSHPVIMSRPWQQLLVSVLFCKTDVRFSVVVVVISPFLQEVTGGWTAQNDQVLRVLGVPVGEERFQSVVVVVSPALQDRCKTFRRRCRQFYSTRQMQSVPSLLLS